MTLKYFLQKILIVLVRTYLLKTQADELEMKFHPTKCEYIAVNSNDDEPFKIDNVTIHKSTSYTYLGALLSDDSCAQQVKNQMELKQKQLRKLCSFLNKNPDCPLHVKKSVEQCSQCCYVVLL